MEKSHLLPQRSRYYHSTIDVTRLEKGVDCDQLRDTYVIFICPFDLFGKGRHRYTFRNLCIEDRNIELRDGTTTVFLNASGEMDDVSSELKGFLEMVAGREPQSSDDIFLMKLKEELKKARKNQKWRREYMMGSIYERDAYLRGEIRGREDGIREGEIRGREVGIREGETKGLGKGVMILKQTLMELGKSPEEIEQIIQEKYGMDFMGMLQEETEKYMAK